MHSQEKAPQPNNKNITLITLFGNFNRLDPVLATDEELEAMNAKWALHEVMLEDNLQNIIEWVTIIKWSRMDWSPALVVSIFNMHQQANEEIRSNESISESQLQYSILSYLLRNEVWECIYMQDIVGEFIYGDDFEMSDKQDRPFTMPENVSAIRIKQKIPKEWADVLFDYTLIQIQKDPNLYWDKFLEKTKNLYIIEAVIQIKRAHEDPSYKKSPQFIDFVKNAKIPELIEVFTRNMSIFSISSIGGNSLAYKVLQGDHSEYLLENMPFCINCLRNVKIPLSEIKFDFERIIHFVSAIAFDSGTWRRHPANRETKNNAIVAIEKISSIKDLPVKLKKLCKKLIKDFYISSF